MAGLASVLETGPSLRAAITEWGVSDAATVEETTSLDLPDAVTLATRLGAKATSTGLADGPTARGNPPASAVEAFAQRLS